MALGKRDSDTLERIEGKVNSITGQVSALDRIEAMLKDALATTPVNVPSLREQAAAKLMAGEHPLLPDADAEILEADEKVLVATIGDEAIAYAAKHGYGIAVYGWPGTDAFLYEYTKEDD